jgi:phosphoserine phosphatase
VVEEALSGLGFELDQIVAGDPRWTEGRIDVGLELPLPYGPDKAVAGRRLLGETVWLATFGDSGFDLDMMQEARFAVGVGGKPQLLAGLAEHPDAVLLAL